MKRIEILENKTLKLQNVLFFEMMLDAETTLDMSIEISKMDTYIKTHGAKQIGPLIQYTELCAEEDNPVKIYFMLQSDTFIPKVEHPYRMETVRRVKDCLYARFVGEENNLKYAYEKLNVYAYENEIPLMGGVYTVFVNHDEENDQMTADIFMPVKE